MMTEEITTLPPQQALDTCHCPLGQWSVIEASAGTGKTWNIARLYIRILIEKRADVSDILVVTFTRAATEELRTRICHRIDALLQWLNLSIEERKQHPCEDADLLTAIFEHQDNKDRNEFETQTRVQLQYAVATFDQASIFTIHSFCQKALAQSAFSSHQPFSMQLESSDQALIEQFAHDFWRKEIANLDNEIFLTYLQAEKVNIELLITHIRSHQSKPLAKIIWPEGIDSDWQNTLQKYSDDLINFAHQWEEQKASVRAVIEKACQEKKLNARSYTEDCFDKLENAVEALITNKNYALFKTTKSKKSQLIPFTPESLIKGTRKNQQTPEHPIFEYIAQLQANFNGLNKIKRSIFRQCIEMAPEALASLKKQKRTISFNDMLTQLYDALSHDTSGRLKQSIRTQFKYALIDEFQDTDPLQYSIFSTIYEPDDTVFLVGDPKQAIYSFRGADLNTYLTARNDVRKTPEGAQTVGPTNFTLNRNFRSHIDVIDSLNALFEANKQLFIEQGLSYVHINANEKESVIQNDTAPFNRFNVGIPEGADIQSTKNQSVDFVCDEIARLINEGSKKTNPLSIWDKDLKDYRPVRANDIAVLVRSNAQAKDIAKGLIARNVHFAMNDRNKIWETPQASELQKILAAILKPNNQRLLFSALTTVLLGYCAKDLLGIIQNEQALMDKTAQFGQYFPLWQRKGCGFALRKLIQDENLNEKILSLPDGDRQMTNLLQLVELLDAQNKQSVSPEAAMRWFGDMINHSEENEENLLRLESDENLVKILTMHSSKGLEFGFVFCPFLWRKTSNPAHQALFCNYHDDSTKENSFVFDYRPEIQDDPHIRGLIQKEAAAEEMRLIYVALTRTVHRCYIVAATPSPRKGAKPNTKNHAQWLAYSGGKSYLDWSDEKTDATNGNAFDDWFKLAEANKNISIIYLNKINRYTNNSTHDNTIQHQLSACVAQHTVFPTWFISSFSGLSRHVQAEEAGNDYDTQAIPATPSQISEDLLAKDDILRFPRGTTAGSCIHAVFELADFTDKSTWAPAIGQALSKYPQNTALSDEDAYHMLENMLADVISTPLNTEGLLLNSVADNQRLVECEFYLNLTHLDTQKLNHTARESDFVPPPLEAMHMHTFFKGFIDLVFEKNNRYYIVDWKSNYLGENMTDYSTAAVREAMYEHHYDWQYLLYTVALHRLLRARKPDYDYERDFGGVFYLFIRGVRPHWKNTDGSPSGTFFYKPPFTLVEKLDALLAK